MKLDNIEQFYNRAKAMSAYCHSPNHLLIEKKNTQDNLNQILRRGIKKHVIIKSIHLSLHSESKKKNKFQISNTTDFSTQMPFFGTNFTGITVFSLGNTSNLVNISTIANFISNSAKRIIIFCPFSMINESLGTRYVCIAFLNKAIIGGYIRNVSKIYYNKNITSYDHIQVIKIHQKLVVDLSANLYSKLDRFSLSVTSFGKSFNFKAFTSTGLIIRHTCPRTIFNEGLNISLLYLRNSHLSSLMVSNLSPKAQMPITLVEYFPIISATSTSLLFLIRSSLIFFINSSPHSLIRSYINLSFPDVKAVLDHGPLNTVFSSDKVLRIYDQRTRCRYFYKKLMDDIYIKPG
ncbi:hypothetical protein AGLY_008193 [Aphis glycines]|uniref:Uncharacterized protein n=1 Tax=Aphis glycines TaxID=307491 RepID=A0A6G0TLK9_APHGL|nr:hypothetical protein AGLY_008193 [Aphis glycines]